MLSSPFAALLVLRLSCCCLTSFAAAAPTEVQYSSAPPQFPGSRIVSKANWGALWDPPLHPAGYSPLPGSNKTKSLNGWAEKPEAQVWALCYSSFTDNRDNPDAFHKQCDKHSTTMVVVKNALNFSFGGYAAGSWGPKECCENSGNWCGSAFWPTNRTACIARTVPYWECGCIDNTSASDFLFRLEGPDGPARKFPDGARVFQTGSACWNCDDIPGPDSKAGYQDGYGSISGPPYP